MVVGGGGGVVSVVHEAHVRGGGWLLVVGGGDFSRDVGRGTDVSLSYALVSLGVALGGEWAMLGSS